MYDKFGSNADYFAAKLKECRAAGRHLGLYAEVLEADSRPFLYVNCFNCNSSLNREFKGRMLKVIQ